MLQKNVVTEKTYNVLKTDNKKGKNVNDDKYKFFWEMREELKERGLQGMTLEEINEEIAAARRERGTQNGRYQYHRKKT